MRIEKRIEKIEEKLNPSKDNGAVFLLETDDERSRIAEYRLFNGCDPTNIFRYRVVTSPEEIIETAIKYN